VLLVLSFGRFLRNTDELQRLIQFKALAIGFGGSFFLLTGYLLLLNVGAPEVDLGDLLVVMPLLYVIGLLVGRKTYL
jgi:hypothetical protein